MTYEKANIDNSIVAINIDNYHPVGHLLRKKTKDEAMEFIHKRNNEFYKEQDKIIKKYINSY